MRLRQPDVCYVEGDSVSPCNMPKLAVEEYAKKVAEIADFAIGGEPADLARRFGGRIHLQDMDDWLYEDGSIFVHGVGDFDIALARYTSPLRDKFTVAHELGHYFLHSGQGTTPIIAFRQGSTRIEWEANWFAAGLLMPRAPFEEECRRTSNLAEIAAHFGVSVDATRVRREAIGV